MCSRDSGTNVVKEHVLVRTVRNWCLLHYTQIPEAAPASVQVIARSYHPAKSEFRSPDSGLQKKRHRIKSIFRGSLTNKKCAPKEVFIAEGKFAGMFGWNLTHTPIGGLMGLPGTFFVRNSYFFIETIIFRRTSELHDAIS